MSTSRRAPHEVRNVAQPSADTLVLRTLAVLIVAAFLRLSLNNIQQYSPADEQVYVNNTNFLLERGWSAYPALVAHYLATPDLWVFPQPLRCGYYALTTGACGLSSECGPRALASVATLAGIVSLLLTWLIARQLFGPRAAFFALILAAVSPIQLALGRRALQDEIIAACFLGVMALVLSSRASRVRRGMLLLAGAVAVATFGIAVKEPLVLTLPGLAAVALLRRPRRWGAALALLTIPPLLYVIGSSIAAGGVPAMLATFGRVRDFAMNSPYGVAFQSGPPHRILIDLALLSPVVVALGLLAAGSVAERWKEQPAGILEVLLLIAAVFAVFAPISKNVRYTVMLDPLFRLAAAWLLARWTTTRSGSWLVATILGANVIYELWIFSRVFLVAKVYDPVTVEITRALEMLPGR